MFSITYGTVTEPRYRLHTGSGDAQSFVELWFAFALLRGPSGSLRVDPDILAAIEQHLHILEGLRMRDPKIARETFARVTMQFWKEQHCVEFSPSVTPI